MNKSELIEHIAQQADISKAAAGRALEALLGGVQSIHDLTAPTGRLGRQRAAVIKGAADSKYLDLVTPKGALYGFVRANKELIPDFDDMRFAMSLLEKKHVLVVPGSSFNVDYRDHFRVTFLPDEETIAEVFGRMNELLDEWVKGEL